MNLIVLNEGTAGRRRRTFQCNSDSTGNPQTGLTFSGAELQVSKNGAAFANAANSGTVIDMGLGVYIYEYSPAEVDTANILLLKLEKAGTISRMFESQVIGLNVYDLVRAGLTALPNANAEAAGGLYTRGSGAGQIAQDANGRIDTRTVAMAADVVTASAIATDAIGSAELAASAATKVAAAVWDEARAGHVAAGSFGQGVASVQGNVTGSVGSVTGAVGSVTGNVGGNVTGSVGSVTGNVGGNVVGSVGSVAANGIAATSIATGAITAAKFAANAVDAAALAADAVAEIQSGLATASSLATVASAVSAVQADTDDIQTRLPAALVGGRMDASVGAMAANVMTAAAAAADFGTEVAAAVDVVLTAAHGAGAWNVGGGGGGGDPNLVLQALLAPNAVPGSLAHGMLIALGKLNTNLQMDQFTYVNGRLTGCRIRAFANAIDAAAGTNPISTSLITAVNGPDGPTSYRAVEVTG